MILCFFRPCELQVDGFAELWTAYEHECKATVTTGRMETSDIVDNIVNRCHLTVIEMTGMCCFAVG